MTYYVACEVGPSLHETEVTVAVLYAEGGRVYLRVERDFLGEFSGQPYLPAGSFTRTRRRTRC